MIAQTIALSVLPMLLALAAGWDLTSFTIPNFIPLALSVAFLGFALVSGMPLGALGQHAAAGFMGVSAGFVLFALGYIGGGDAKLFGAVLLWLGFADTLEYVLVASTLGGALTLGILGLRTVQLPGFVAGHAWIARLHDARSGIPYGVALGAGAFVVLPYTEIFRTALHG